MRIDELRSVLDEHADAIHDAPQARLAPVRQRVAVIPLWTGSHLPFAGAPDTLAGRAVPHTMHATGFTYRYARGYQSRAGASTLDVGVDVATTPRLVAWASSDRSSRPVVRLINHTVSGDPQVSGAGGFGRYTLLYPVRGQQTQHLRLRQVDVGPGTRLAVAVYDPSDPRAAGVGNDQVVFRRTLAGEQLVKAVVGKPGQHDLRLRVTIASTDLQWSGVCYASRLWYSGTVNGHGNFGSKCQSTPDLDAGQGGATYDLSPFARASAPATPSRCGSTSVRTASAPAPSPRMRTPCSGSRSTPTTGPPTWWPGPASRTAPRAADTCGWPVRGGIRGPAIARYASDWPPRIVPGC